MSVSIEDHLLILDVKENGEHDKMPSLSAEAYYPSSRHHQQSYEGSVSMAPPPIIDYEKVTVQNKRMRFLQQSGRYDRRINNCRRIC